MKMSCPLGCWRSYSIFYVIMHYTEFIALYSDVTKRDPSLEQYNTPFYYSLTSYLVNHSNLLWLCTHWYVLWAIQIKILHLVPAQPLTMPFNGSDDLITLVCQDFNTQINVLMSTILPLFTSLFYSLFPVTNLIMSCFTDSQSSQSHLAGGGTILLGEFI